MLSFNQLYENHVDKEVEDLRDQILDKIGKEGIGSLTQYEKDFLNTFKNGNSQEFFNEKNKTFEDDMFKFVLSNIEDYDGEEGGIRFRGTMEYKESNHILKGSIVETATGKIISSFRVDENETDYDIVDPEDFGYYESFLSYVIDEISSKNG